MQPERAKEIIRQVKSGMLLACKRGYLQANIRKSRIAQDNKFRRNVRGTSIRN